MIAKEKEQNHSYPLLTFRIVIEQVRSLMKSKGLHSNNYI